MSTPRIIIDQWKDKTEEPAIVWVYTGFWKLQPVAVDDSHDNDVYQEYAAAFFAARAYQTFEEVQEDNAYQFTPAQIEELYSRGGGSAEAAGLPAEMYAEGCSEDGSDALFYVDESTLSESHRESLEEALHYLEPEDVAEIYRAMLEAQKEANA